MTPITLRGINRSGLEYSSPDAPGSLERCGFSARELDEMANWGANLMRLPVNQDWALSNAGYDGEPYLEAIDWAVEQATARGMYTMIDLQWLDATFPRGSLHNGSVNFVPSLPDERSLRFWRQIARRYFGQPSVLFDLLNEPHNPLDDDESQYFTVDDAGVFAPLGKRRVGMKEWQPWARQLIRVIREESPQALIFLSGVDWGYDLTGFPLKGATNVVYSSHAYPAKKLSWDRAFGRLAKTQPVFLAEFGGGEADLHWGEKLLAYLDVRSIGWAAWSWSDHPHLLRKTADFEPTPFGALVRDALRRSRMA